MHAGASIVFDLDGTLVDTADDLAAALNHVLAEAGRPTIAPSSVRNLVGQGARALIERGFAATGVPVESDAIEGHIAQFLSHYRAHIACHSRPFPGVRATLERLSAAGLRLGVCTNKPESLSHQLLEALGLKCYLPVIIGADTLPVRKPDPRPYFETVRRLGGTASHSVMVGDSITDIATARAAGVPAIAVTFGYTTVCPQNLGADALIGHFDELETVLPQFWERRT